MKIVCQHCKSEFENCTSCNSPDLEQKNGLNIVVVIVALLATVISGYRWYDALDEHERAQRLRRAYLKDKLESRPTLPIAK